MISRLRDETTQRAIIEEMKETETRQPRWERTFVSSYDPEVEGLSILELGRKRGTSPEEALVDLLIEKRRGFSD